jgi:hypothetical protein
MNRTPVWAAALLAAIAADHARSRKAVVHAGSHDEARIAIEAGAGRGAHRARFRGATLAA